MCPTLDHDLLSQAHIIAYKKSEKEGNLDYDLISLLTKSEKEGNPDYVFTYSILCFLCTANEQVP